MRETLLDLAWRTALVAIAFLAVFAARGLGRAWARRRRARALELGLAPEVAAGTATVLMFSGSRCVDCDRQRGILQDVQTGVAGRWRVHEVKAAADPALARRFGVESVPATVLLDPGGRAVEVNYGLVDAGTLRGQLAALLAERHEEQRPQKAS
jgi:thioredoxin-like negative regulator of GroEL